MRNIWGVLKRPFVWGLFILAIMQIGSMVLRQHDFNKSAGAQNLEAPYHVLLTVTALSESTARNHWYLPTVSLGRDADKHISWGATIPTKTGDYIYTSFTPIGFLAPYVWFKAFNLEPSITHLTYFNYFLGTLSMLAIFMLLFNLLKYSGYSALICLWGALIGSTIAIFSREALLSQGVIYWSQSLYQPILIFSLYLFFKYVSSTTTASQHQYFAKALIVAAFVGASTEWTGYIFNAGLVCLLWLNNHDWVERRVLAKHIVIATTLAGFVTVAHYGLAVGFDPAIKAFLGRFLARNTSTGSIVALIQGYGLSYGLFLLTTFAILMMSYFGNRQQATGNRQQATGNRQQATGNRQQAILLVFVASCIPLLENMLMLQHATQFSFDRLKFILPASLILAFSFARLETKWRTVLVVLILASCFQGWKSYKSDNKSYATWGQIDFANKKLVSLVAEKIDMQCAVFFSNLSVRGYANLLLHRSLSEGKSLQQASEFQENSNACASVYLEGTWAFPDLPKYAKATVIYKNGYKSEISSDYNN